MSTITGKNNKKDKATTEVKKVEIAIIMTVAPIFVIRLIVGI